MRYNGAMAGRRQKSRAPRRRRVLPWAVGGAVVLAFFLMMAALARQPRTARVGDHWHARLTIELCGRTLPPLPPGPFFFNYQGYCVIYTHPQTPRTAGRNASLETFFRTTPVRITPGSIAVAGERYQNGDPCPDGRAGILRAQVRRAGAEEFGELPHFLGYLPRDGDEIRIVFGP